MNTIDEALLNHFPLRLIIPALACIGNHYIIFVFDHEEMFQHKLSNHLMMPLSQNTKKGKNAFIKANVIFDMEMLIHMHPCLLIIHVVLFWLFFVCRLAMIYIMYYFFQQTHL